MVNPDVDGCTKAQNHRKFLHKAQKKLLKTKGILNRSISYAGARVLHLACRRGQFVPLVVAGRPRYDESFQ